MVNFTSSTVIFTLSLHDALPISTASGATACSATVSTFPAESIGYHRQFVPVADGVRLEVLDWGGTGDRKSTRLNSSHMSISYAVFCLKIKIVFIIIKKNTHKLTF